MKLIAKFFTFLSLLFLSSNLNAAVSLKVRNEAIDKNKILFYGFDSADPKLQQDIDIIFEKIRSNLKSADIFKVIKQEGEMQSSSYTLARGKEEKKEGENIEEKSSLAIESVPDFEKYSRAKISAIIIGRFSYNDEGNLEVRIRMWDILDQRQLFGKFYTASIDNYAKLANIVSNEIFKAITGEKYGHFDSQIIYVSETGSIRRRVKKIIKINFDGTNRRVLTSGSDLVLTPIFSKEKNKLYYLRYFEGKPQIFSFDSTTLESEKVGGFRGTTFSAGTNPKDKNLILLSAIINGNSDIYEFNIKENKAKRLTTNRSIDTTPSYSPDGDKITFASDRHGRGQQIYVISKDGTSLKRISQRRGSYSKPVWSPDGRFIAFTKSYKGRFYIGVMSPKGKGEKLLASGYMAEGARWSPSGRYLIYSKKRTAYGRGSIPRLYVIDITTGHEIMIPTPENEGATDPDWQ